MEAERPDSPSPGPPRRRAAVAAALAVAGVALWFGSTPLWWVGLASLTAAWVLGRDALDELLAPARDALATPRRVGPVEVRPGAVLAELLAVGVVLAVAWAMLSDVASGDRPVSHDHPVHFFKAWQLRHELLPAGELFGWSHRLFAGYPVDYLYPPGADLFVSAVHLLGFGALGFSQAYALAFVAFHGLTGYAVYRFGQRFAGRVVGVLAAVVFLSDPGYFRYGGWAYTIDYGVWPQTLSLALALLALARLPRIVAFDGRDGPAAPRYRAVGSFGVLMGASLVCHPVPLFLFPPLLVLTVVLVALLGVADDRPGAAVWRLLVAHGLGVLVACLWLLPFFDVADMADKYGVFWKSTYQLGADLLELGVLKGSWPLVLPMAVVGAAVWLRRAEPRGQFVAWSAVLLLAMGCSSVIDELHLASVTDAVAHVQFSRLTMLLKPFAFVAAGYGIVWIGRRVADSRTSDPLGAWRRAAAAFVLALVVAPIAVSFVVDFYTRWVDRELPVLSERSHTDHRDALVAWLADQPREGPLERVAYLGGHHEHGVVDLAVELGRPLFKSGFTPCSNFVFKPEDASADMLEAVGARWVVARKDLEGRDYELAERFGPYRVYAFARFEPDPFFVRDGGSGPVELVSFEGEEIVLRAGEGARGRLQLRVSWFPRWQATRDGEPVPITAAAHPRDRERTGFMTVELAPGEYRFRFERTAKDRAALWLALLGLLLAAVLALGARGAPGCAAVVSALAAVGRSADRLVDGRRSVVGAGLAGVVGVGLLGAVALAVWTPPLDYEGSKPVDIDVVHYDFLERLPDARVDVLERGGPEPCDWRLDRFVCRPRSWFHVASRPERIEGYSTRRCISAHALSEGPLRIAYPDVPLGDTLVGYYGVAESGKKGKNRPVSLTARFDGEVALKVTSRRDAHTHWFAKPIGPDHDADGDGRAEVTFTVEAPDPGFRQLCFYAQVVSRAPAPRGAPR